MKVRDILRVMPKDEQVNVNLTRYGCWNSMTIDHNLITVDDCLKWLNHEALGAEVFEVNSRNPSWITINAEVMD